MTSLEEQEQEQHEYGLVIALERLRRFAETRLPAGYATAIETMVERMEKLGVRVLLGAALIDIKPGRENSTLSFQGITALVMHAPHVPCLRARERATPHWKSWAFRAHGSRNSLHESGFLFTSCGSMFDEDARKRLFAISYAHCSELAYHLQRLSARSARVFSPRCGC